MRLQSDKEKVDFIVAVTAAGRPGPVDPIKIFRCATGLSRTTYFKIKSDEPLKGKAAREKLDKAVRSLVIEPGSAFDQEQKRRLYKMVESNAAQENDHALGLAEGFARTVIRKETPTDRKLLLGIPALHVFFRLQSKNGQLRSTSKAGFCYTPEAELNALVSRLIHELKDQLSLHEAPPGGVFPGCTNPKVLKRSFRVMRLRYTSNAIGWAYKTADGAHDRAAGLKRCYSEELLKDFAWAASIDPNEVGYLYNPLMQAIHADDHLTTRKLAAQLYAAFPKLLTGSVATLKPLVDDFDALPVLAVVAQSTTKDLAVFRNALAKVRIERPALDARLRRVEAGIDAQLEYNLCITGAVQ